jgi:hypothetical protein
MNKSIVAAATLAGVTALTGASVAPAMTSTAGAKETHVLKWRLTETASHDFTNRFVGTDVIRSARTGKIVGYDSTTGRVYPQRGRVVVQVAASLKGGILIGQVGGRFDTDVVFHGRILKGTGKYRGAQGTMTARPSAGGNKTFVRIVLNL